MQEHTENRHPNDLSSLSPEELNALKKRFPILFRTDPLQALKLFRDQPPTTQPLVESPFVLSARKGKLPPKVTSGK